jgi:2,3-bisphosphoglycerate-dependent phosphoglycerate mutase
MKIYLVRHGKPEVIDGKFYESRLGEEGIKGAEEFISSGKIPKPDMIFASPFNRAKDTANVFAKYFSMSFQILENVREWDLQSLNLKDPEFSEIQRLGWENQDVVVKGGESLNDVKKRIVSCIEKLSKEKRNLNTIIIAAHGTVIDMFCSVVGKREAKQSDIKSMNFLDYAIAEHKNDKLNLLKDIIN